MRVESSLRSPNSSLGQWVDSFIRFPSLTNKVRAFYKPLGFDVWVEESRISNVKTLMCKPNSLESVIAYAETIDPEARKTISHYVNDVSLLRRFMNESLKHSSGTLIYEAGTQRISSYPQFDYLREEVIASLDFGKYHIKSECFIIAVYFLLNEYSACNDKVKMHCKLSCNDNNEWTYDLSYSEIEKSKNQSSSPRL